MTVASDTPPTRDLENSVLARWWDRRPRTRAQLTEFAIMIGALSVVTFWAAGIGIVAGLVAVATALWAYRSPDLEGERAPREDTALAVGSGALGIVVGVSFLFVALPNW